MLFKVFHDVAMNYVFNEDTLAVTHAEATNATGSSLA